MATVTTECPICTIGMPHTHSDEQVVAWERAKTLTDDELFLDLREDGSGTPM